MRVFVGMKALRGDASRLELAEVISLAVMDAGHEAFVASAEIERRGIANPNAFMAYVLGEMRRCQAALIVYEAELRGGLIELGMAYALGLPVWLAAPADEAHISSSALGCAETVIYYPDLAGLAAAIQQRLRRGQPPAPR